MNLDLNEFCDGKTDLEKPQREDAEAARRNERGRVGRLAAAATRACAARVALVRRVLAAASEEAAELERRAERIEERRKVELRRDVPRNREKSGGGAPFLNRRPPQRSWRRIARRMGESENGSTGRDTDATGSHAKSTRARGSGGEG